MKKLMNLKGVKKMDNAQQKKINGGRRRTDLRLNCFYNGECLYYGPECAEAICGGTPIPTPC